MNVGDPLELSEKEPEERHESKVSGIGSLL